MALALASPDFSLRLARDAATGRTARTLDVIIPQKLLARLGRPTAPTAADDDYSFGAQAHLDLTDLAPTALPARVICNRRVEPRPRATVRAPAVL